MKSNRLYQVLLEHSNIEQARLDSLLSNLEDKNDARALASLVVQRGLLSFSDIMRLVLDHDLTPRSKGCLERLAKARSQHQVIKPKQHVTRYKLGDDDVISEQITLKPQELVVPIPRPDLTRYASISTDERQVVEMAVELVNVGQYSEAEMFLIDARDEFPDSVRVPVVLIWLYLLTHHFREAREVCTLAQKVNRTDINLTEFAGLTDQALEKHLLAINHYQQLTLLPKTKPIWYLLLAFSLEHARLPMDAGLNYRIFISLSKPDELRTYATRRLNKLVV